MLILAPAPDDSGTAADTELALHMVLQRPAFADLGQLYLLWKEAITVAPGRRMSAAKEKARLAKRMQSLAEASEATGALQLLRNTGDSLTTADIVPKLKALFPKGRLPLARRYTDPHNDDGGATLTQQPAPAQSEHGQYARRRRTLHSTLGRTNNPQRETHDATPTMRISNPTSQTTWQAPQTCRDRPTGHSL